MSLPDIVVRVSPKEKTAIAKACRAALSPKGGDARPVHFFTDVAEGEFDRLGWVIVPAEAKEVREQADRIFTRSASEEEDRLGADKDNEQLYRIKDGVEQRRVAGTWVKSMGVTTGKSDIPAHVRIFGHRGPVVSESLGMILDYISADEYIVGVQTEFGPVPRRIRLITE